MKQALYFSVFALALLGGAAAHAAVLEQGLFEIEHHPDDAEIAARSAEILEAALAELEAYLPAGADPIRVIISYTMDEFMVYARQFGNVSVSGVARSREGLIILKGPRLRIPGEDYRGTLRHELVHVLLFRNTTEAFLPSWLNEGLSMSLANEHRWGAPARVARMVLSRRLIKYSELNRVFSAPGNDTEFGDAYAQALSMTRYLRDTLGDAAFWAVVLGTREYPFAESLARFGNMSPREFWEGYQRSLWLVAVMSLLASGSLFGPASIILIIAYFRKQAQNKKIVEGWDEEEAQAAGGPAVYTWDEILEGSEVWSEEELDEDYYFDDRDD